jgi:hypothetical protein
MNTKTDIVCAVPMTRIDGKDKFSRKLKEALDLGKSLPPFYIPYLYTSILLSPVIKLDNL